MSGQIVFFKKVTLYTVTIVTKLPQKHQYVHLTGYDYSFELKFWVFVPKKSVF